jgi:hypothetical protein
MLIGRTCCDPQPSEKTGQRFTQDKQLYSFRGPDWNCVYRELARTGRRIVTALTLKNGVKERLTRPVVKVHGAYDFRFGDRKCSVESAPS